MSDTEFSVIADTYQLTSFYPIECMPASIGII